MMNLAARRRIVVVARAVGTNRVRVNLTTKVMKKSFDREVRMHDEISKADWGKPLFGILSV